MRKLALVSERRAEEAALRAAAAEAEAPLAKLDEVYAGLRAAAPLSGALEALRGIYHGSALLAVAHSLHEARARTPRQRSESSAALACPLSG